MTSNNDPNQSIALAHYKVTVLSVSLTNGVPTAKVTDGFGRTYPPIALANRWGSGVQPYPGEQWMILKDSGGIWTFKSRLLPITSLATGLVDVMIGSGIPLGTQVMSLMGSVSVTTSNTGVFTTPLPLGYAYVTGYAVSVSCSSAVATPILNLGSCTLSQLTGSLHTSTGTLNNATQTLVVTALGA